ncbi:MAG: hypothetical protein B5M56_10840 [Desulfococcus sp. 4484_241]|nr:MAG: hypothetical protein B5M56_10840 [Desulfococcus sp. 4484_241]
MICLTSARLKMVGRACSRFHLIFSKIFQEQTRVLQKKMLNAGIADPQRRGAPAELTLTAQPVLTKLLFSDVISSKG